MVLTELEQRRSLVPFHPRQVPLLGFDVIVVGAGAAGSSAALAAAEAGAFVAVLTKAELTESNTHYAQGGMAAVLSEEDSFEQHVQDTLDVGCGLAERETVDVVIRGGPAAVERLLGLGARFDRTETGALQLSREGGHTRARIIHAGGDATGVELQRALCQSINEHPRITPFPNTLAIDLLHSGNGAACGVLCRTATGELLGFSASQVILASGGGGQIYRETTNPVIATADGVAMGVRAGAVARDLEFVQFHPTCLYIAGAARVLISEIVRGHGGVLRDRNGERFMPGFHPAAELAPRDVVSRAVSARMVATKDTNVYLDLSGMSEDPHRLFPGISRICGFFGIDIARDPIPVRPGAHYMIGGLDVDLDGRTSVEGLWAAGECASTGLHGANRMGSNSLLEGVVLGMRAGERAAAAVGTAPTLVGRGARQIEEGSAAPPGVQVNIADLTYSLKSLMWRQMGVERDEAGLADAFQKIQFWSRAVSALAPLKPRALELENMLLVAQLATIGARARTESRGVHYRRDHPERRDELQAHTVLTPRAEADVLTGVDVRHERVAAPVSNR